MSTMDDHNKANGEGNGTRNSEIRYVQEPLHVMRARPSEKASHLALRLEIPPDGAMSFGELTMLPSPLVSDSTRDLISAIDKSSSFQNSSADALSRASSLRRPVPVDATRKYVPLYDVASKRIISDYIPSASRQFSGAVAAAATAAPTGILTSEPRMPPQNGLFFGPPYVLKRSTSSEGLGEFERLHRERSQYVSTTQPSVPDRKTSTFVTEGPHKERQVWNEVRPIGNGAFSTVVLARPDVDSVKPQERFRSQTVEVAIKITNIAKVSPKEQQGIKEALRREIAMLGTLRHPSLIRLFGVQVNDTTALLVLPHCAGGDMFDLASSSDGKLKPPLVRRMFAELANAVAYLHRHNVVHRDIKLENVLVNIPREQLLTMANPVAYPKPIITLTDLGLSRRIDPENPLLTTRCGSEDYVPPELLMGQPYDGRQTDSWALGVLLYAVIENRLPFDPPHGVTGARARGRTAHRIARVEWSWIKLKGDVVYDSQWDGAKEIVEGCLQKRNKRLLAARIVELPWVSGAIAELRYDDVGSPVDNLFA